MSSTYQLYNLLKDIGKKLHSVVQWAYLYQFTVMLFSLSGTPATFQWMMDQNLSGLSKFVGVYLDDIVIYSSNWTSTYNTYEKYLNDYN